MWSCVLLCDASAGGPVSFSSVTVVPASPPMGVIDVLGGFGAHPVVMAAPASLASEAATVATLAAGRWPDLRLARLISDHAPLALLSALALARGTTHDAIGGLTLTHDILGLTWSGAWSNNVASLEHPAPRLSQHARSLLPGGDFLIRQHPDAAVLRPSDPTAVSQIDHERVLLVQEGEVPQPVVQRLASQSRAVAVRPVNLSGDWRSVYGSGRTGQIAIIPADARPLLAPMDHRCPSCGEDLAWDICPFCHLVGAQQVAPTRSMRFPQ